MNVDGVPRPDTPASSWTIREPSQLRVAAVVRKQLVVGARA
jgi:hypothetical protein